jgi:uncharacterized protein (DUF2141 family)
MNTKYSWPLLAAGILLINGCAQPDNEHTHEELGQLQLEIEQLTNEVGRLEFRIFELENRHPESSEMDADDQPIREEADKAAKQVVPSGKPGSADKGYDLTPAE